MSDVREINLDGLARGDVQALAEAISLAENSELTATMIEQIHSLARSRAATALDRARIGITGTPGVGKSTLTNLLIHHFRSAGKRVGVLAVDPSSALTGGALLGDRIRMQDHYLDSNVFIRSMSARGHLGGLALSTPLASELLTIAGYAPVIIETVGVGQSEVEVMRHVDTTIVVLAPGGGDDIQSAKAGILEIADLFIINKVDRDNQGAEKLRQDIRRSQELSARSDGWKAPVLLVSALDRVGVAEMVAAICEHQEFKERTGG